MSGRTKLREVPLFHHVYSSVGGYKTLYFSRELPGPLVEKLDRFSTETYDKIPAHCPREVFFTEEGYIVLSKKFVNGSDHVGRSRTCVHNILVRRQDVSDMSFFNPFLLPDSLFIPPDADLQFISRYIQRIYLAEEGEFVDLVARVRTQQGNSAIIRDLLLALLSGRSTCIIRGPSRGVVDLVEQLTVFLPPTVRQHLGVIAFYPIKQYIVSLKNRFSIIILSRKESVDAFVKDKFIVIDFAGKKNYNLPKNNALVEFITESLFDGNRFGEVLKLLKILEKHRINTVPTPDLYETFLKAYRNTSEFFTPDGGINVSRDPIQCLENVLSFYRSGYWNIALDIIEKCFRLIINKQYFRSFDSSRAEQIGMFVNFLKDTLKKPEKQSKTTMTFSTNEAQAALKLMTNMRKLEDVTDFEI